jgi:hypothetical protein
MKYSIVLLLYATVILLVSFAAQSGAQGISSDGTIQEGVMSEGVAYEGTGTVQDSTADGDIKVIDLLDSDAEVKAEDKPEGGTKKGK